MVLYVFKGGENQGNSGEYSGNSLSVKSTTFERLNFFCQWISQIATPCTLAPITLANLSSCGEEVIPFLIYILTCS